MKEVTEREIKEAALSKARRTYIRLKYALLADAEIAREMPKFERYVRKQLDDGNRVDVEIDLNEVVESLEITSVGLLQS